MCTSSIEEDGGYIDVHGPQLTESRRYITAAGNIIAIYYRTLLLLAVIHPPKDPPIHFGFLRNFSWIFLQLLLSIIPLSIKCV